jgi:uncharacterized membrane protein
MTDEARVLDPSPARAASVDVVRGVCLALVMADATLRLFLDDRVDPSDLLRASAPEVLAPLVTGLGAPGLGLAAGMGLALRRERVGPRALARAMLVRGLALVLLEALVLRLAWRPDPFFERTPLGLPFALGGAMVLLAPLVALPWWALGLVGGSIVTLQHLLDPIEARAHVGFTWSALHVPERFEPIAGHVVWVAEPILPWVGVLALGMALGRSLALAPRDRARVWLGLAVGSAALFALVRGANGFGDPRPWLEYPKLGFTVMAVLRCTAHPPSLAFLLLALPVPLGLLALAERGLVPARMAEPLAAIGRSPALGYGATLLALGVAANLVASLRWGAAAFDPSGHDGHPGLPLWACALAALIVMAALPSLARWLERWRAEAARRHAWLALF